MTQVPSRPRPILGLTVHPSAVLLLMQVLAVVSYPFVGRTELSRAVISAVGTLVIGLAIWVVRHTHSHVIYSLALGIPAVILSVFEVFVPENHAMAVTSAIVHALFYFYTSYCLVMHLFGDDWVTSDDLYAAGAAFTVVAWGYAYVYSAIQILQPGSFVAYQGEGMRSWFELLYLSFANLTSVGLSDVVAVLPHARAWVMLEQLTGVLYVAMVISRMITMAARRGR